MALGVSPFFNLKLPPVLSNLLLDRNGYVQLPSDLPYKPAAMPQTTPAAQPTRLGGPATQQLLRNIAADPAHWHRHLAQALTGPDRVKYLDRLQHYHTDATVDQSAWEAAASETGLPALCLAEASQAELTPGAQLFALVSNLSGLGLLALLSRSPVQTGLWLDEVDW